MKKITIEINVPDDFTQSNTLSLIDDAERLANPDWLTLWWHVDDVFSIANNRSYYQDLTLEEARQVLEMASDYHDADIGVSWETLKVYLDEVVGEREGEE
jgi:hypothetical protein